MFRRVQWTYEHPIKVDFIPVRISVPTHTIHITQIIDIHNMINNKNSVEIWKSYYKTQIFKLPYFYKIIYKIMFVLLLLLLYNIELNKNFTKKFESIDVVK